MCLHIVINTKAEENKALAIMLRAQYMSYI